jgi:hypothetical protein
MARVIMEPGWQDHLAAACDALFEDKLGPAIAGDAKRYAPVRTGELRDSIGHHLEGHALIVEASAPYAAYVELGHRIAHGPRMSEAGPKVARPQPFLRPALYQTRGE